MPPVSFEVEQRTGVAVRREPAPHRLHKLRVGHELESAGLVVREVVGNEFRQACRVKDGRRDGFDRGRFDSTIGTKASPECAGGPTMRAFLPAISLLQGDFDEMQGEPT